MGWGKLDDNLHDHHKVDELNDVAPLGLWTLCLTWAHRHRRTRPDPSFVPWGTVDRLGRRKARAYAKELLRVKLWEPADGGIRIHDFGDYLPGGTDEERSEKARKAARARWDNAQPDANEHPSSSDSGMPEDASRASARGSDSLSTYVLPTPTPLRASATSIGNDLLTEHLAELPSMPRKLRQQTGQQIDELLAEDYEPDVVREALARLRQKSNGGPGLLPALVGDVMRERNPRRRTESERMFG